MTLTADAVERIADVLDHLPKTWQDVKTRAELYHALETAETLPPEDIERCAAWERVRYLSAFANGTSRPLYGAIPTALAGDTEPPGFCEMLAALNRAAGWAS